MSDKDYDAKRRQDPDYQERRRIYNSSRWKFARRAKLAYSPICEFCREVGDITAATDVDHITPLAAGGEPYDPDNLQSLCAPCHSRKTMAERHGGPLPEHRGCCVHGFPRDPNHPWNLDGGCRECGGEVSA